MLNSRLGFWKLRNVCCMMPHNSGLVLFPSGSIVSLKSPWWVDKKGQSKMSHRFSMNCIVALTRGQKHFNKVALTQSVPHFFFSEYLPDTQTLKLYFPQGKARCVAFPGWGTWPSQNRGSSSLNKILGKKTKHNLSPHNPIMKTLQN